MKIELILDEPDFFRLTRLGNWYHALDYETGKGEWYHTSDSLRDCSLYLIAAIGGQNVAAAETHATVGTEIPQGLHAPSAHCSL